MRRVGKGPEADRGFPTMLRNFSTDLSLQGRKYEIEWGGEDLPVIV
jgi:hypothetical protein